jgi:FAD binding domain
MNSGVGDAVDLGWKLAAVLQDWGGPNLLTSYDAERRPVGLRNVGIATDMYQNNENFGGTAADLERDDVATQALRERLGAELERIVGREFRTTGAQLGYRYYPSPICVADGTPAPPDRMDTYLPIARPGSRAPHAWLADGRSTLDLFGRGLTLLRFAETIDTSGFHAAAAKRGVSLSEVAIGDAAIASLYERTLVLVRPDGHVAWRGDALPSDAERVVDQVTGWT